MKSLLNERKMTKDNAAMLNRNDNFIVRFFSVDNFNSIISNGFILGFFWILLSGCSLKIRHPLSIPFKKESDNIIFEKEYDSINFEMISMFLWPENESEESLMNKKSVILNANYKYDQVMIDNEKLGQKRTKLINDLEKINCKDSNDIECENLYNELRKILSKDELNNFFLQFFEDISKLILSTLSEKNYYLINNPDKSLIEIYDKTLNNKECDIILDGMLPYNIKYQSKEFKNDLQSFTYGKILNCHYSSLTKLLSFKLIEVAPKGELMCFTLLGEFIKIIKSEDECEDMVATASIETGNVFEFQMERTLFLENNRFIGDLIYKSKSEIRKGQAKFDQMGQRHVLRHWNSNFP